jgi:hypothetical protein
MVLARTRTKRARQAPQTRLARRHSEQTEKEVDNAETQSCQRNAEEGADCVPSFNEPADWQRANLRLLQRSAWLPHPIYLD